MRTCLVAEQGTDTELRRAVRRFFDPVPGEVWHLRHEHVASGYRFTVKRVTPGGIIKLACDDVPVGVEYTLAYWIKHFCLVRMSNGHFKISREEDDHAG